MPKIKVEGKVYEAPTATLGELRTIKRLFGVNDLESVTFGDPDFLAGLVFITIRRERPGEDEAALFAEVEAVTQIELVDDDEDDADRPTEAAEAASPESAATDSSPVTTPADSGIPPSVVSTD